MTIMEDSALFVSLEKKLDFGKVNRKGGVLYCMYLHPSLDCVQSEKRLKQNKEYCLVWVHNLSSEAKTRISKIQ